ncbi:hypothetical protein BKA62DRAFT_672422 [Auriculariales sp. MPI-PUGE-AT-0066]|nr:hypothetical protein BKA62DRAFT_672422 [Auriculariales sp. MPI-PUGE-AT-0066]
MASYIPTKLRQKSTGGRYPDRSLIHIRKAGPMILPVRFGLAHAQYVELGPDVSSIPLTLTSSHPEPVPTPMNSTTNTIESHNATADHDFNDVTTWSPEQIKAFWAFLFDFLEITRDVRYFALAIAILVLYDHLITLDQEVELACSWRSRKRLNVPNILYFINRYFIYLVLGVSTAMIFWPDPPDSFCIFAVRFSSLSGTVINAVSNASLILRQYAFWNRNKWIGWGLGILLLLSSINGVANGVLGMLGAKPTMKISLHGLEYLFLEAGFPSGCYMSSTKPSPIWASFIGVMVFDTALFVVTVVQSWRLIREFGQSFRHPSPIIRHLLKTGTWYFLIVFCVTLVSFVTSVTSSSILMLMIQSNILPAMTSLICSRMLLYIRADLAEAKTPHLQTKPTSEWPNSPTSPEDANISPHFFLRDDPVRTSHANGDSSGDIPLSL